MNYASIDIGTNSVLLMIVEVTDKMKEICDTAVITRLGEGLHAAGVLSPEAMDRTISTLMNYKAVAERNQVRDIFCFGTAALRKAKNRDAFREMARKKLSLDVKVMSEYEEAFYTYISVCQNISGKKEEVIVIDVGGGSTEVMYGDQENFIDYISLPIGSVTLTEMFVKNDPPRDKEIRLLTDYIKSILTRIPFKKNIRSIVGTAGTVTTLGRIALGLREWNKKKIHGLRLTSKDIDHFLQYLLKKTILERSALPGMEKEREDIIVQGIILLQVLMDYFGADELIVDANGVRHGVLCEKVALLSPQI